jgi:hypothetical protein
MYRDLPCDTHTTCDRPIRIHIAIRNASHRLLDCRRVQLQPKGPSQPGHRGRRCPDSSLNIQLKCDTKIQPIRHRAVRTPIPAYWTIIECMFLVWFSNGKVRLHCAGWSGLVGSKADRISSIQRFKVGSVRRDSGSVLSSPH